MPKTVERGVAIAKDILDFGKGTIGIVETETKIYICLLADRGRALQIHSTKLATYDCNGDQTCNITKCNACNRSSERIYNTDKKLKHIYPFLKNSYAVSKLKMQIGIFDLFFRDKKFIITFFLKDNTVYRGIFPTNGLYDPGCYPEYSKHFMALDQRREVIFKIDSCVWCGKKVFNPISFPQY